MQTYLHVFWWKKGFENNVFKFCFQVFKTLATTVTQTNNEKNNECPSLRIHILHLQCAVLSLSEEVSYLYVDEVGYILGCVSCATWRNVEQSQITKSRYICIRMFNIRGRVCRFFTEHYISIFIAKKSNSIKNVK